MRHVAILALVPALVFALLTTLPAYADSKSDTTTTPGEPSKKTASTRDLSATIDGEIDKVLKRDKIKPSARSSDSEFLRRVYLDTVGEPPTLTEATTFLESKDNDKRAKLIDTLIDDPRFGRHMADLWTVIISGRDAQGMSGRHLFAMWIAERFNRGDGFDKTIRAILTARGNLANNAAVTPYFGDGNRLPPEDLAGRMTKTLMGVQTQCAQCHDHPYDEDMTTADFNGMMAFFSDAKIGIDNNVQPRMAKIEDNSDAVKRLLRAMKAPEKLNRQQKQYVERYRKYAEPKALDDRPVNIDDPSRWRFELAKWWTDKGNIQTRRYVANRFFSFAFGSGIMNPVDDFNPFNEASHPELLDALADDLWSSGWDIKRLYRGILNSNAYQRSSQGVDPKAETWHFASYPVRQLNPEQFMSALISLVDAKALDQYVTTIRDQGIERARKQLEAAKKRQESGDAPANMRRYRYDMDRYDSFAKQFQSMDKLWYLRRFASGRYVASTDDDEMNQEEAFALSIDQALAVMNGQFTNNLSGSGDGTLLGRIKDMDGTLDDKMDAMYLTILGRKPTADERTRMVDYAKEQHGSIAAWEDILFALLMTTEFATNH